MECRGEQGSTGNRGSAERERESTGGKSKCCMKAK